MTVIIALGWPKVTDKRVECRADVFNVFLFHSLVASEEKPTVHNAVCVRIPVGILLPEHIPKSRLAKNVAGENRSCLNALSFEVQLQIIAGKWRGFSHD